ncbi:MAG: hypothetical protein U1E15_04375 [Hyphomicrobiales bacterium]
MYRLVEHFDGRFEIIHWHATPQQPREIPPDVDEAVERELLEVPVTAMLYRARVSAAGPMATLSFCRNDSGVEAPPEVQQCLSFWR